MWTLNDGSDKSNVGEWSMAVYEHIHRKLQFMFDILYEGGKGAI